MALSEGLRPREPGVVSVIVPARDAARTLGEQLAALASQEGLPHPLEIVVVDNGSSDDTADVVARHADASPSIRRVWCANVGINHARNRGVTESRGDVVLVCDADDVVSSGWVRAMVDGLASLDVVGGPVDVTRLNPPWLRATRPHPVESALPTAFHHLPYCVGANMGFRRVVFDAIGGFDDAFPFGAEEIDFCWRAQYAGFAIGFVPGGLIHYRFQHDAAALARQFRRYALGNAQLYAKHVSLGKLQAQTAGEKLRTLGGQLVGLASFRGLGARERRWQQVCRAAWLAGSIEGLLRHGVAV